LTDLGVIPQWRVPIVLADGRQEQWSAAEILLTIDGRTLHTTCLFGPPDGLPLLGAVSLEQFALAADPLARTLTPTRVPMAASSLFSDAEHLHRAVVGVERVVEGDPVVAEAPSF
jgi:hypothetical protein